MLTIDHFPATARRQPHAEAPFFVLTPTFAALMARHGG
jgi:hypothetical protein